MRVDRHEFVRNYFHHLEARGIEHAVLEGDEEPLGNSSRVLYVVRDSDLPKIGLVVSGVASRHGWVVAQTLQPELFSFRTIAVDPDDLTNRIVLDVCSHYTSERCLLVRDSVLLHGRDRDADGFVVVSKASEFTIDLARVLQDDQPVAEDFRRLRALWSADPDGAQQRFDELVGETGRSLADWFAQPPTAWAQLGESMRARTAYRPALRLADTIRSARLVLRPAGLHITVLGPDGVGKSTLIENVHRLLQPFFDGWLVFQFRPDVFNRIVVRVNPDPHGKAPRSPIVSWAKVAYYFGDHWLGWLFVVLPARARNAFVVFDRDFDDLMVDQRRYILQRSGALVRVLRQLLPRGQATFILHGDPQAIHARKPELPFGELGRQQAAYRSLAANDQRYHVVSVDHAPDEIANAVTQEVIALLARRSALRISLATRAFNLAIALPAIALLSPVLVAVTALVRLKLGRPILFKQERPGYGGRPFTVYKFRTMTEAVDASGKRLPDADRLTRFGSFLRSTSLDELPELFNVLTGEMSLVGPRPLLTEYLARYSPEQMRRHDLPPGITGWAQIHGRNAARWPDRFALDVWYVDHRSMSLDLKILALTVLKVLRREGISQPGRATSAKFYGNEELAASGDQSRSR